MKRYTTRILSPTERAWRRAARLLRDEPVLFLGGVGAALVIALGLLWGTPSVAPGPVIVIPTATPALAVANAYALPRAVVAFDAPDGRPLGAIDAGVTYRPLARYGGGWVQIETAYSGPVWVRADELNLPGAALADYAPPQVQVIEVVRTVEVVREVPAAQPAQPAPAAPPAAPAAPPAPTLAPVPAELVPLADPAPTPTVLPPFAPGATAAQLAIPTLPPAPRDCPLVLAPERLRECEAARAAEALRHTAR